MLARLIMVTASASLALLFGAPEDALACHRGDPHGSATSCDGGGGGGGAGDLTNLVLVDATGVPAESAAILVDEKYGAQLLADAERFAKALRDAAAKEVRYMIFDNEGHGVFQRQRLLRRCCERNGVGSHGQSHGPLPKQILLRFRR